MIAWTVVAGGAERMLREMRPLLIVKGPQADVALEFRGHVVQPDPDRLVEIAERERLFQLCRSLKQQTYDHIELPRPAPIVQDHAGKRLPRIKKPKPPKKVRVRYAAPVRSTGYDLRKKPVDDADIAIFAAVYRDHGLSATAREYGVAVQTVVNWLDAFGIPKQGRPASGFARRSAQVAATWRDQ